LDQCRRRAAHMLRKSARPGVEDLQARLEKLLTDAEDCAVIGKLATEQKKRELFNRLATDLRSMARDLEAVFALRRAGPDSDGKKPSPS
jgi:hypothetical protein